MLLKGSAHSGSATYESMAKLAEGAIGRDQDSSRAELVRLVRKAEKLSGK